MARSMVSVVRVVRENSEGLKSVFMLLFLAAGVVDQQGRMSAPLFSSFHSPVYSVNTDSTEDGPRYSTSSVSTITTYISYPI